MAHLLLVKHSLPEIVPGVPPDGWQLSNEGLRRCKLLAGRLAVYQPEWIISSPEPKALQTSRALAAELCLPIEIGAGLYEHLRSTDPFDQQDRFEEKIARFFAEPDRLVYGEETAREAQRRFNLAVKTVLARHKAKTTILVAHGTVVTLFVMQVAQGNPFSFWKRLGLPSLVVLALPDLALDEVVEQFI